MRQVRAHQAWQDFCGYENILECLEINSEPASIWLGEHRYSSDEIVEIPEFLYWMLEVEKERVDAQLARDRESIRG
jgi:hypothetical protein